MTSSRVKKQSNLPPGKFGPDAGAPESSSVLSSLFWNAPVALALLRNQTLGLVNRLFLELTGGAAEELTGRSLRIFYGSKEEYEHFFTAFKRQVRQKGKACMKTTWLCAQGRERDLELTAMPLEPGREAGQLCLGLRERLKEDKSDILLDLQTSLILEMLKAKGAEKTLSIVAEKMLAVPGIDGLGVFLNDDLGKGFSLAYSGKARAFFEDADLEIWLNGFDKKNQGRDCAFYWNVRELPPQKRDFCLAHGVKSLFLIPLKGFQQSFGWLLAACLDLTSFSRQEEMILTTMTRQLAVCLETNKLNRDVLNLKKRCAGVLKETNGVYFEARDNGKISFVSPGLEDYCPHTKEDLLGESLCRFWADPNQGRDFFNQLTEKTEVQDYRVNFLNKKGRLGSFLLNARLSLPLGAKRVEIQGFLRPTAVVKENRFQVFSDLHKSWPGEAQEPCLSDEDCWQSALHAMPQMICVREPTGGYRFCNKAMADFFGLKAEEVGQQVEPLFMGQGRSRDQIRQEEEKIIKNGETCFFQEILLDAKGRPHEFEVLKTALPQGRGVFISAVDVTEKKLLENQLRQAQKMEAMGSLAGGVAHDFNNILTAIMGYAELATEDIPEEHSSCLFMRQVLKAGGRAKELVRQILAFSRQETLEMKPVNLKQVLQETVNLLRASIPTSVDIRTKLHASRGLVMADQTQLHQVFMNLGANAAHAMREGGGVLLVTLAEVQVSAGQEGYDLKSGDYYKLAFSDTGHGMDERTMERIFEPFFTTKNAGEGTGMGLSMVRRIIMALGGEIKVESTPGVGSVFEVILPEFKGEELTDAVFDSSRTRGGRERILFVDDETSLVELGANMLGRLGYKVTGLNSSSQALELFNQDPHAFDLVVTDQTMPGVSGVDLARRFLRTRPELPIILCTGFSAQISRESARKMGISRFLMKPVEISEIARVVREVLDEKSSSTGAEYTPHA
ncbi:ATP-binding protein [Dethiosulfatarculus sandiegensis]|uniref:histidine kinase n=1 Tax=Dethiosulfatarculus sandiegensis TaxID=1429043 RepID=A0A0D2K0U3_9BACT|nr:ATP-binding protein [Dethiosulfatarculus sandiegensis]KIX15340.1 histidine kinase [Dethiosulfatarculus sandiegensis]